MLISCNTKNIVTLSVPSKLGPGTFFFYIEIISSVCIYKKNPKTKPKKPHISLTATYPAESRQITYKVTSLNSACNDVNISKGYIQKFWPIYITFNEGKAFRNQLCFHFLSSQNDLHCWLQIQNTAISLQNIE